MDEQMKELETLVAEYQAAPTAAPGAFNFLVLLPILKLVIPLVIQDEKLREIVQKVLDILSPMFVQTTGEASE